MGNYLKSFFNTVSFSFIIIGSIGFLGGFLVSLRVLDYTKELPLSAVENIEVSNNGNIYLGLHFYGKIQVYNEEGKFLMNWDVQNQGGSFKFDIVGDTILIASINNDKFTKHDLKGNIISQEKSSEAYFNIQDSRFFFDSTRNTTYEIKSGLFPKIEKSNNSGKITLIEMPILLEIFKGPFPAWLLFITGLVMRFSLNRRNIFEQIKSFKQIE